MKIIYAFFVSVLDLFEIVFDFALDFLFSVCACYEDNSSCCKIK